MYIQITSKITCFKQFSQKITKGNGCLRYSVPQINKIISTIKALYRNKRFLNK